MIFFRVSTISTGSAAAFDSAFARRHGVSAIFTLKLLFFHSPAVSFFNIADARKFSHGLPSLRNFSPDSRFVPPFRRFFFWQAQLFIFESRQSRPSVLMRSSSQCLLATAIRSSSKHY